MPMTRLVGSIVTAPDASDGACFLFVGVGASAVYEVLVPTSLLDCAAKLREGDAVQLELDEAGDFPRLTSKPTLLAA